MGVHIYIPNDRSELIASLLDDHRGIHNVVDLGCNDGATLLGLRLRKSLGKINFFGVDYTFSDSAPLDDKISYHECDLNGELLEIKKLLKVSDLTLLLDVLEHLHKPEQF